MICIRVFFTVYHVMLCSVCVRKFVIINTKQNRMKSLLFHDWAGGNRWKWSYLQHVWDFNGMNTDHMLCII